MAIEPVAPGSGVSALVSSARKTAHHLYRLYDGVSQAGDEFRSFSQEASALAQVWEAIQPFLQDPQVELSSGVEDLLRQSLRDVTDILREIRIMVGRYHYADRKENKQFVRNNWLCFFLVGENAQENNRRNRLQRFLSSNIMRMRRGQVEHARHTIHVVLVVLNHAKMTAQARSAIDNDSIRNVNALINTQNIQFLETKRLEAEFSEDNIRTADWPALPSKVLKKHGMPTSIFSTDRLERLKAAYTIRLTSKKTFSEIGSKPASAKPSVEAMKQKAATQQNKALQDRVDSLTQEVDQLVTQLEEAVSKATTPKTPEENFNKEQRKESRERQECWDRLMENFLRSEDENKNLRAVVTELQHQLNDIADDRVPQIGDFAGSSPYGVNEKSYAGWMLKDQSQWSGYSSPNGPVRQSPSVRFEQRPKTSESTAPLLDHKRSQSHFSATASSESTCFEPDDAWEQVSPISVPDPALQPEYTKAKLRSQAPQCYVYLYT